LAKLGSEVEVELTFAVNKEVNYPKKGFWILKLESVHFFLAAAGNWKGKLSSRIAKLKVLNLLTNPPT